MRGGRPVLTSGRCCWPGASLSPLLWGAHLQSGLCVQQGPGAQLRGGWPFSLQSPSHSVQSWEEMAGLSDVEAETVGEGVIPRCQL